MHGKKLVFLAVCFCLCITGCNKGQSMDKIIQVTCTADSGAILPELQWHEIMVITPGRVVLTRNGKVPDTQVNTGSWEIPIDEQQTAELFEKLNAVERSAIKRVEPQDAPDGGGTETFTITYESSPELSLMMDPGTTYTNAEGILLPLRAFIKDLALPAEAASRHKSISP